MTGVLVPPGPVQVSENVVSAPRAAVLCVPLTASAPVHAPAAAHVVASVELHVNVDVPPASTLVGLAVSTAVGNGGAGAVTVTVTEAAGLVPEEPVQVKENVVSLVRATVLLEPLVSRAPLHPPEAVHEVASVDVQVSVAVSPLTTLVGAAVMEAVGTGVIAVGPTVPPHAANTNVAARAKNLKQTRIASLGFFQSYVIGKHFARENPCEFSYVKP